VKYLLVLPEPDGVPSGQVVVHNHVYPVSRRPGARGSRCWVQPPASTLESCPCGWAPELGTHFRVAGLTR
jgi:hypothetical protein